MARLFGSKSTRLAEFKQCQPIPDSVEGETENDDDEREEENSSTTNDGDSTCNTPNSTPFIGSGSKQGSGHNGNTFPNLDIVVAVLRKSLLVTCSVERDEAASSMDISWPTQVRHVSHVTFDRFNGFLGLPSDLEPEVPRKVPSASASVFGASAKSMQCSYDTRGNSVPTILLMMQKRLYAEGGLIAEGIFRINPENSQEEFVRNQLNKGLVPRGIDVHCLAGLIKAWFRELPTGVLDLLTPEEVMHCNTEDDSSRLVTSLPLTEAALLDWAINLMSDVVEHERYNKMNARNIAMVFAPNMTKMADPLTALIHAVQVMNFLKTLISKNLREREQTDSSARLLSSCLISPRDNRNYDPSKENIEEEMSGQTLDSYFFDRKFLRTATLARFEAGNSERFWNSPKMNGEDEGLIDQVLGSNEKAKLETRCDGGDGLGLRKGVRRFCRHPVFQMSKPMKKAQTRDTGIIDTMGREEASS